MKDQLENIIEKNSTHNKNKIYKVARTKLKKGTELEFKKL